MALNIRPSGLVLEKKRILAWHDTTLVYVVLALFSMGTVIFSLTGIKVALDAAEYAEYVWIPKLLLVMSAVLLVFSVFRLLRRGFLRFREGE